MIPRSWHSSKIFFPLAFNPFQPRQLFYYLSYALGISVRFSGEETVPLLKTQKNNSLDHETEKHERTLDRLSQKHKLNSFNEYLQSIHCVPRCVRDTGNTQTNRTYSNSHFTEFPQQIIVIPLAILGNQRRIEERCQGCLLPGTSAESEGQLLVR